MDFSNSAQFALFNSTLEQRSLFLPLTQFVLHDSLSALFEKLKQEEACTNSSQVDSFASQKSKSRKKKVYPAVSIV